MDQPNDQPDHTGGPVGGYQPPVESAAARAQFSEVIEALERTADLREDHLFTMVVSAMRAVYSLYPDADEPSKRGTPEQRARIDIHNALVQVCLFHAGMRHQSELADPNLL